MAVLKICGASERGDLELGDKKNRAANEDGRREYSFAENAYNYTMEFCKAGSIHGIPYLAEHRTWIEKVWWAISLVISLYFSVVLIYQSYIKWETSPVIVNFATKETPMWRIPFPAVTICPASKASPSIFNYTYYLHRKQDNLSLTEDEERKFGYLSYICDTPYNLNFTSGPYADERMLDFLEEVQPNFFETAFECKFLNKRRNCKDLFVPLLTDDGICYVFNIMDRSQILSDIVVHHKNLHKTKVSYDWTIEHGYNNSADSKAYPRRAPVGGIAFALQVKLKVHDDDLDYTCGEAIKGFKVQLTHPQRIPRIKEQHFIVPLGQVMKASVAPDMTITSDDVKAYNPFRRGCYFPSERSLKYFSVYTQNNCAIECRTNYTLGACGCVPFYVPREQTAPICGAENRLCLKNAIRTMLRGIIQREINNKKGEKSPDNLPNCKCLPICTSMYFNIENTQAYWDWRTTYKFNRDTSVNVSDKKIRISLLQVFFKNYQFINSERNELYGFTDFLANVGGLLGLFVGFSALTIVEVLYYLTLRIICNIMIFGKRNWSGTSD